MSQDPTEDISLTDSATGPETDPDTNTESDTEETEPSPFFLKTIYTSAVETITETLSRSPISPVSTVLSLLVYITLLAVTAVLITPFHAFGLISATTGIIILTMRYHPAGNLNPDLGYEYYMYPATGLVFIGVGLRYLLMGILFSTPFY